MATMVQREFRREVGDAASTHGRALPAPPGAFGRTGLIELGNRGVVEIDERAVAGRDSQALGRQRAQHANRIRIMGSRPP